MKRFAFLLALLLVGCVSLRPADVSGILAPTSPTEGAPRKLGSLPMPGYAGDFLTRPGATGALTFGASMVPIVTQTAPSTDVAPKSLTLSGQGPLPGATVNKIAADVVVNSFASAAGGVKEGGLSVTYNGSTPAIRIGAYNGNATYGAIWFADAGTPTNNNWSFLGNQSATQFNVPTSGTMIFTIANATNLANWSNTALSWYVPTSQWVASVTNPTITQVAASGVAQPLTVTAQAAGGTNDGGSLSLGGGAPAGAGTVYGSTKITTPLNGGYVTFSAPGTTVTLTAAQSAANFMLISGGVPGGAFTVTIQRRAADTSCVWVRNAVATQTANVQYLTGTAAAVATGTSALLCSDGTNLQKIMGGT